MNERGRFGCWGERTAAQYLEKKNIFIVEKNFRCRVGEIDLIGMESGIWIFIEVKSRRSLSFGRPCESVTPRKQKKIRQAAEWYRMQKKIQQDPFRFDVVEVLRINGKTWISHITAAF